MVDLLEKIYIRTLRRSYFFWQFFVLYICIIFIHFIKNVFAWCACTGIPQIHSKNILDLKKDTNLYITILKRIILEIPPQFNNGTIKELKGETKKKILKEFELKKDLCLFIYNEIIEVLNHNLILNEVGNFKN